MKNTTSFQCCEELGHVWMWIGKNVLDNSGPPDDFLCKCGKVMWKNRHPVNKHALFHVGVEGCDKIAFYTTRRLIESVDYIEARDVVLLDGSRPIDGEDMICGSCGRKVWSEELKYHEKE